MRRMAEGPEPPNRAPRPRLRTWGRRIVRIVRIPTLVYIGLTAVLAAFQDPLIFPGRTSQGRPEADFPTPPGAERVTLRTADGTRIAALFGPASTPEGKPRPDAAARPTILYCYGNGMYLAIALDEFDLLRRQGANVLIPEYPGYGLSEGVVGEAACYAAADAGYAYLKTRSDIDPDRIIAAGWSLGGAVAIDLASREPVAGLIALSTFTRLADVAGVHFPLLPHSWLLRHRFESDRKIRRVGGPILLIHGARDSIIPCAMMGHLAREAGRPVTTIAVEGADHNDLFDVGRREIAEAVSRFLDQP
jgi:pimeloyl-ACP methyl ester carboxylesterase